MFYPDMQHTFSKHLFLYKWCKNLDFRNVQDCDVTTEAGCQTNYVYLDNIPYKYFKYFNEFIRVEFCQI